MVMAQVYHADMFEMQEARIQRLLYRDKELQAIPCMGCTLRGGRQRNPARIPQAALAAMGNDVPRGVKGSNSTKGRGRAALLRERARKARERQPGSNSAASFQDDTSSIASSALSTQLGDEMGDDRAGPECLKTLEAHSSPSPDGPYYDRVESPYPSRVMPGQGRSPSPMTTAQCYDRAESPYSSRVMPSQGRSPSPMTSEQCYDRAQSPYFSHTMPSQGRSPSPMATEQCPNQAESSYSTDPVIPGPGRSPSPMNTTQTTVPQPTPETAYDYSDKQLNLETNKKTGRKKTKFVKLDVAPYYEEYQSELLVGIPAGSEGSNFGRTGFDKFNLGTDHTPCFIPGYRDQRKPKVNSIVDFPGLRNGASFGGHRAQSTGRNANGEIPVNFMNSVPRKSESMKSIASFITDTTDDKDCVQGKVLEVPSAIGDEEEGCVVIIENVPERIKRKDLTDLIEPYGSVSKIHMEQTGRTQRAYVSMGDALEAAWVVDILDDSDSLIEAESTAPKLKLRIQT